MKELFYEVLAKCGHVGRNNYIDIKFPVRAKSKKEAAERAREFPRVKHNQKDAIRYVKEISVEEFEILVQEYQEDGYNFAHSKQEQRILCGEELYNRIRRDSKIKEVDQIERDAKVSKKMKYYKCLANESRKYINSLCYL